MNKITILKSSDNRYYQIIKSPIPQGDYLSFACFYRYNPKTKRIYGNWSGLGWFTRNSHAIRSLRRRLNDNLEIV